MLEAVNNGFNAIEGKMATKDDLKGLATKEDLNKVIDLVGTLQGQVSPMETDIKTIKGDVKDVHRRIDDVEKLAESKVSYVEFNDRLRPIEQRLGIAGSQ